MLNSRDIKDLHPKVQAMANAFVAKCKANGIDVLITSTYRDLESQQALYDQGRSIASKARGEKIVTNAKAGQSYHNYRLAFDFCPIVNGKAQWNDIALFTRCGVIAESLGFEWAGRWKRFKEYAHCQMTEGLTVAQLGSGKKTSFMV